MRTNNLTGDEKESYIEMVCGERLTDGLHTHLTTLSVIKIFLSIAAIWGNTLILAALHKESSLHPPSKLLLRCLATTDLCAGLIAEPLTVAFWLAIVGGRWKICRFTLSSAFAVSVLLAVSLWTVTAISVDRLLALLLGLRYRQVVTLRRTWAIVVIFWVISMSGIGLLFLDYRITFWGFCITMTICISVSIGSYTKIFFTLHRKTQVRNQNQQESNQPYAVNAMRFRKAVYSALWLQMALVFCILPYAIVSALTSNSEITPTGFFARQCAVTLLFLNLSLNPILYCWKMAEVRQTVKGIMRQLLMLA